MPHREETPGKTQELLERRVPPGTWDGGVSGGLPGFSVDKWLVATRYGQFRTVCPTMGIGHWKGVNPIEWRFVDLGLLDFLHEVTLNQGEQDRGRQDGIWDRRTPAGQSLQPWKAKNDGVSWRGDDEKLSIKHLLKVQQPHLEGFSDFLIVSSHLLAPHYTTATSCFL
ncbi:hypothetical protein QTP70_005915 [Hemibagrus guttatus]|uniref:Uncharacterized protein n=1 Tax=Hemibagrus guttatus TaxID=175788 RepID=A0AAE0PYR4_9TELE|nr:hypothetical protein QTP70_005915 [Hemibagrus guttatus]